MYDFNTKNLEYPIPITDQKWDKNIEPLVSIGCITYNHENYIKNAIEGFLIQKTTFPVEIIIHDDASTDKTSNIIQEYEQQYPNLFINIYQNENQFSKGNTPIFANFIYPRVRGKYIALCEGDDNWTDPQKLQKQIDFLEANPDHSLCSHETFYTYINDPNNFRKFIAIIFHNYKLDGIKRVKELITLFFSNSNEFWKRRRKHSSIKRYKKADFKIALNTAMSDRYIPTMSIVTKSELMKSIPNELYKLGAGHRLIILWSALHGKMHHMNNVMGFKNTQESSLAVTKIFKENSGEKYKFEHTILLLKQLKLYAQNKYKSSIEDKIEFYKSKANYQENI